MKILIAAAAATLAVAPALAQEAGGVVLTNPEFADGFNNRGQCQAALAHVRNSQRADASTRGAGYEDLSTSAFQAESLRTTRCEQIDGRYQVVFYVDGY